MRRDRAIWLAVVAAIGVAAVAVTVLLGPLTRSVPAAGETLRRPPAGTVRADYLADGTPVWVIGHKDGSVDVLSGFDTHTPLGIGKLLWWCEPAFALENPHHGSKWDEHGVRLGGPAPIGLPRWEVAIRGTAVAIGDRLPGPPMGTEPTGPSEVDREWCTGRPDQVVTHTFPGWHLFDSPREAMADAPDGWFLLSARLVDRADGTVALCAVGGCDDAVIADGVEPVPPALEPFHPVGPERFLARVRDESLVDLTRTIPIGP